ncbi:hypothetical protein D3C77_504780 [compost metagenome]
MVGSTLGEFEVNKPSGDVRVAMDDQSEIDHIVMNSNTTLTSTTADDTHQSKENVRNIDDGLRNA